MQYIYHLQTSDTAKYNFEKLLEQEDRYFAGRMKGWAHRRTATINATTNLIFRIDYVP